jgi:hypothetical protein
LTLSENLDKQLKIVQKKREESWMQPMRSESEAAGSPSPGLAQQDAKDSLLVEQVRAGSESEAQSMVIANAIGQAKPERQQGGQENCHPDHSAYGC